jgi:hypothetical protein
MIISLGHGGDERMLAFPQGGLEVLFLQHGSGDAMVLGPVFELAHRQDGARQILQMVTHFLSS